jgi:hypothetical protein
MRRARKVKEFVNVPFLFENFSVPMDYIKTLLFALHVQALETWPPWFSYRRSFRWGDTQNDGGESPGPFFNLISNPEH